MLKIKPKMAIENSSGDNAPANTGKKETHIVFHNTLTLPPIFINYNKNPAPAGFNVI